MKKLAVWDFDDTIIRTPGPESFKRLLNENIMSLDGINKNRFSFWDNPLSLDEDYFQLVSKKPAIDLWNKNELNPNISQILITNRCTSMLTHIDNILESLNIKMDGLYSGSDNGGKIKVLKSLLNANQMYDHVQIIEDSIYNLYDYQEFLIEYEIPYELYFVNTHSMGMLDGKIPKLINLQDIEMTLVKNN